MGEPKKFTWKSVGCIVAQNINLEYAKIMKSAKYIIIAEAFMLYLWDL